MARTPTSKAFQKKVKKCLGALLSEYQQNAGLSQQDLCDKTLFWPKHMHLLMRGKVLPRLDTLLLLLEALGDNAAESVGRLIPLVFQDPTGGEKQRPRPSADQVALGEDTCPKCQAVYTVHARRVPVREQRKFKCGSCNRLLASWTGTTAFSYRLIAPPKNLR
jgi:predicted Zn finger-like uncharacterized protein